MMKEWFSTCRMRIFIPPSFMTRSVEEEKTEDVNVPETVDPGEEP